ncbi:MAG TPA: MBL fold metallo-hydrolase [Gaiellaceae bacterium]|nr:MBL fold metallo-hydrolase [Gaiellaceae bacterium]
MLSGPLDLLHLGRERVIGAYLLESPDGPALYESGPSTTVDTLKQRLAEQGLELTDLRHLLLSHIHLDHAGAAGVLVREHPGLTVHVSAIGAPHLADPARLEKSARRLYGDLFDELWGELAPVPEENIRLVGERVLGLECFPSPGHARHHVCYLDADGTLYAGDSAGVRIQPSEFVLPPAPPPEFEKDAWLETIDEIERRAPQRLALVHFGVASDPDRHLAELRDRIERWTAEVEGGIEQDAFIQEREAEVACLPPDQRASYGQAIPFWHSYLGIRRWADKRRERAA